VTSAADASSCVESISSAVGQLAAHRAMAPANSLNEGAAFDFGTEVTLMKLGTEAGQDIFGGTGDGVSLPIVRLQVRKGFGGRAEFSLSGITTDLLNQVIPLPINIINLGGGFKVTLYDPKEGPTLGASVNYSFFRLPDFFLTMHTISSRLLISRKIGVVIPYGGFGTRVTYGRAVYPVTAGPFSAEFTTDAYALSFDFFVGVYLNFAASLALEMAWASTGSPWIGVKIGFGL
jgi:hypothetical protein